MGENEGPVLYEIRRHVSGPCVPNYPPQQVNEAPSGSFLSLISGVSRLKQKWNEYREPRKLKRLVSLFVSPSGEHVAVAIGNRITILHRKDDYREPCGIFINRSFCTFTAGAWSDYHDVLGVADDSETLYFIKSNGNEIGRIMRRNLRVPLLIISLMAPDDHEMRKSSLCGFTVVTCDGSLQHIEICQDSTASVSSTQYSNNSSALKGKLHDIICLDYHPKLFLLAAVGGDVGGLSLSKGSSGCYLLSFWHRNATSDLEHLYSTEFKGVYSLPKGYQCHQSYPKVLISPRGTFAAALDVTGDMHIFRRDTRGLSLVNSSLGRRSEVQELLSGILDFTWWSDHILTLAKRSGVTTMIDVKNGLKVKDGDPAYSISVLQRVQEVEGHLFLIETTPSDNSALNSGKNDTRIIEQITEYNFDQFDLSRLRWSLISFSEKSIQEMYKILIFNKKYEAALEFAHHHGLDRDDVMKSQWLHSDQGKHALKDFLIMITDQDFVLTQCVEKVGLTEDAAKALLEHGLRLTNQYVFSKSEDGSRAIWDCRMTRLQLLQYMDRLETYMGINMGRFSVQEYFKFRDMPLNNAAVKLAESGKIGALNLLFKRHPYSLIPFKLEILAAIPETIPVQTYKQLLPGSQPPANIVLREEDWVECEKMVDFIQKLPMDDETAIKFKTEPIVKRCLAYCWLPTDEILSWYKKRAIDIDSFSGQLDNCLCLVDVGRSTGINALQHFYEDISYLNQLIYTDDVDGGLNISLSLVAWEDLSDYEKFKMMLRGVKVETVIERLRNKAIPFMESRLRGAALFSEDKVQSFLVRWLREIASENKLDLCLVVIDEGCRDLGHNGFFKDEIEAVDSTLQCIYRCSSTDQWSNMATILSKLPQVQGNADLEGRLKLAEAHIEAGRILAYYQVPKPINFFLEAHSDEKVVKQIFRLILSKFVRRQAGQSDNDWASMWRDMQSLREKAFTFLDAEYMLIEFCKGLLKAGKFSLARNYLKGTSTVALAPEKAESLVIQAAREYFFSASTLACSEIWKAKECLNLFPGSSVVKAENDIIDALTTKLPRFGVTLLPVQFRQIKDPMEIIKMLITSQPGAYLDVDEIIEVSKLLGLRSKDEISAVEEAIAREAAVTGDLQLAFDLCLVLVKKGHGLVWDLCAAIARGPGLENMDVNSRKLLLGFALSNCDEESIGEMLNAWKDLDMQGQCETLMTLTGTGPKFSVKSALLNSDPVEQTEDASSLNAGLVTINGSTTNDRVGHRSTTENIVLSVARDLPLETGSTWDSLLQENERMLSFAASELPWLIKLSRTMGSSKKLNSGLIFGENYVNVRAYAVVIILSWLSKNGFAPRDDLIVSLAKSVIESQASEWEDILGCSVLLNLVDAFNGVEVIEEELRRRQNYQQISSIMNVGMKYGLLHNSGVECEDFNRRRELLLRFFKEKHMPVSSDEMEKFGNVQSTFWREWKLKLEERKHVADHSRVLEQIIPGVDTPRFLSGDIDYIKSVIFSLIESVKMERKHILQDLLKLTNTYSLNRSEVLLRFLCSVLVSDIWTNDDITAEIAEFREEIVGYGQRTVETISMMVYPAIDGHKKHRLAYLYGLLSDCCLQLDEQKKSPMLPDQAIKTPSGLATFYKVIEQECRNISFVKDLNFKNIVGLGGLNIECFQDEVYCNIDEHNVEALANMVQALVSLYAGIPPVGLMSWQDVYKYYILSLLMPLLGNERINFTVQMPETYQGFIGQVEHKYEMCRKYIKLLTDSDIYEIMKQFFVVSVPNIATPGNLLDTSAWQECLILLMNFYIRLTEDIEEVSRHERSREILRFNPTCFMKCLKSFTRLVIEDTVSPSQGWGTIRGCINSDFMGGVAAESSNFCRAMIFSGCGFGVISEVFSEAASQCSSSLEAEKEMQGLPALYLSILEPILQGLASEVPEYQNLCNLLSSLSKLEGDMENQKRVRHVVWERMANYSNDLQLPGHIRVYALELMQSILGRPIKSTFTEKQLNVLPWEGWHELHDTGERRVTSPSQGVSDYSDTSNRFTSTLVALRSSQIMASICPSLEITPDDLVDIGTAASCFSKLCRAADNDSHLKALVAVLGEWEGLFVVGKGDKNSAEVTDAGNDWDNDDWREGWESFQEVEPLNIESKQSALSLHPLHVCWSELIQRHVALFLFGDVLLFLDLSLSKPNGILLDEENARSLQEMVLGGDFLWAFKMMMLLPYGDLQLNCVDAVEEKLKQEGMTDGIGKDLDVLILVLYSGVISKIICGSSYDSSFSYICYLVGYFSRQCQEACLLRLAHKEASSSEDERASFIVFERILLPVFICELIKADQKMLAGFIITKYMHTNASLSLINIAEAGLWRFLEGQLNKLHSEDHDLETALPGLLLKHAVSSLLGRLADLIPSALSLLSAR